jgi:hypothetical protein
MFKFMRSRSWISKNGQISLIFPFRSAIEIPDSDYFHCEKLVAVHETLYILGTNGGIEPFMRQYNTFTDQWTSIDSLQREGHDFGGATVAKNGRVIRYSPWR